jgi:glycosyltransferase involved in cell wall biosynthesis
VAQNDAARYLRSVPQRRHHWAGADTQVQFHVLSFEGPDAYARAGGIASRISGLASALAHHYPTHLWFIGDPSLPGREASGSLELHRWCQWISQYHLGGVYDGEESKQADYAKSLPPYLCAEVLLPHLHAGGHAVILAEEWHTVHAVLHLDWLLREAGVRDKVRILWNANNVFGFERIDWRRLTAAATITTVSRYMKHLMWPQGVDAIVIPNGLSADAFLPPDRQAVAEVRRRLSRRTLLAKVARFDPDKRWLLAIDTVAELKRRGRRPLLIARGGVESHGREVFEAAAARGLHVREIKYHGVGPASLVRALCTVDTEDVVHLETPLDAEARRTLFRGVDAVLANSGREPFGLVGLEAMAAGGIACTGCTGEDYAVAGRNALVLQTSDPREFVGLLENLRNDPAREQELRRAARVTARAYAWPEIIERNLLPRLDVMGR